MTENLSFSERRRKLALERGQLQPEIPESDIPDVSPDSSHREFSEDPQITAALDRLDILDAYRRWCGKKVDESTVNRTEGIKISCPIPGHADKTPSAWINKSKGVWFCGPCQQGGDLYDIAAYYFGFNVPDYKTGSDFPKLRESMAEDLGFTIQKVIGGTLVTPPEEDSPKDLEPPQTGLSLSLPTIPTQATNRTGQEESEEPPILNVTQLFPEDDEDDDDDEIIDYPSINWKEIVEPDTFLWEYMLACCNDDSPEEYHFWHGLIALGLAVSKNISLDDSPPVYGNLLVCLVGGTGAGKTKSRNWLNQVIRGALRYEYDPLQPAGVKIIPTPQSGQFLVKAFEHEIFDLAKPKLVIGRAPITGIVDYGEYSGLNSLIKIRNSTLKSQIQDFSDGYGDVTTGSMGHNEIIAKDPFCSITSTTQLKSLRYMLTREDASSGLLNRWFFAMGQGKEREVIGGTRRAFNVDLTRAVTKLEEIKDWSIPVRKLIIDDEAESEMKDFYRNTLFPQRDADKTDLLNRLDLLFKKIILLLSINLKLDAPTKQVILLAKKLYQYLLDCYGLIGVEIGNNVANEICNEIIRHITRLTTKSKIGRGPTYAEVARCMRKGNVEKYSHEQVSKQLDVLCKLGLISIEKPKGSGRQSMRYRMAE